MADVGTGGLKVTVLGCCGSYPHPGGACSGYLVDDGTTRLCIDAGSGSLANLQRHCTLQSVDGLLLSHEHPDHWTDVDLWVNALWHVTAPIPTAVFAPAGLKERTYKGGERWMEWNVVTDADRVAIGTMTVAFSRTDHPVETLAMRVEAGGLAFGYSADTGPGWSLEALGPGLDLAVCEATIPATEEGNMAHLSARQAGASARDAGVRRLVLTHLWPYLDPAQVAVEGAEAFGAPVEVATTNACFTVGAPIVGPLVAGAEG